MYTLHIVHQKYITTYLELALINPTNSKQYFQKETIVQLCFLAMAVATSLADGDSFTYYFNEFWIIIYAIDYSLNFTIFHHSIYRFSHKLS